MLSLIKLDWFLQFDKGFNGFQLKGGYAELKYPAGTGNTQFSSVSYFSTFKEF